MTPYTAPGITLNQSLLIDLITQTFNNPDRYWVNTPSQLRVDTIPRHVLIACLHDFLGWSFQRCGDLCERSKTQAYYSHRLVHSTLMDDSEFGERVLAVYKTCCSMTEKKVVRGIADMKI